MTDLLVRNGTVVTTRGTAVADVAVEDGRIVAVESGLAAAGMDAAEEIDASGLLVLPGAIDAHTHTRVASDAEPDRFFRDSVAAAFGGTTTFLAFNNPGTGSSEAAHRSLITGIHEFRARTEADSAVDFALSPAVLGQMEDALAELPAMVEAGVPTAKAFMVFDFRLPDRRLFDAMRVLADAGGMLEVHCEDPVLIDAAVASAVAFGNIGPAWHARTRSSAAEAVATHRAMAFAAQADAPVYVVHLSSSAALEEVARARAAGVRAFAETCPHYLAETERVYDGDDDSVIRYVISPPLRSATDRDALWAGLRRGDLSLIASDHVPDRLGVEKRLPAPPFPEISNGAPGIETLLTIAYSEGVAAGRISIERLVDLVAATPARLFGLRSKGAIEPGKDADLVLFDPSARRTIRASELHHASDYSPYEGRGVTGAVRSVFVRGRAVVRGGHFVGERGFGRFVERSIDR